PTSKICRSGQTNLSPGQSSRTITNRLASACEGKMVGGKKQLSAEAIDAVAKQVGKLANSGDKNAAWDAAAPLLEAQPADKVAARTLLDLVSEECLSHEHALAALNAIEASHAEDVEIVSLVAENLDRAVNINFLNAPPLDHPIFPRVITMLERAWRLRSYEDE